MESITWPTWIVIYIFKVFYLESMKRVFSIYFNKHIINVNNVTYNVLGREAILEFSIK